MERQHNEVSALRAIGKRFWALVAKASSSEVVHTEARAAIAQEESVASKITSLGGGGTLNTTTLSSLLVAPLFLPTLAHYTTYSPGGGGKVKLARALVFADIVEDARGGRHPPF